MRPLCLIIPSLTARTEPNHYPFSTGTLSPSDWRIAEQAVFGPMRSTDEAVCHRCDYTLACCCYGEWMFGFQDLVPYVAVGVG